MPNPFSLIALDTVAGSTAGKFAEIIWSSAEGWLNERFGTETNAAETQAHLNAADFVGGLAVQLGHLETRRRIDRPRVEAAVRDPRFSALLQRSLLNAAETEESDKHALLADLVAARLLADADTAALPWTLASDAIARSSQRQIKLTALCSFLFEFRPHRATSLSAYRQWLRLGLRPFEDVEFQEMDARHLVAVECASYDPAKDRGLQIWLGFKLGPDFVDETFDDLPEVETLQSNWNEGLRGMALTSAGSIVGVLSLDQLLGAPQGVPHWD